MKLCALVIALLSLAFLAKSQTTPSNGTWYVTNMTFSPYLGHYYEACWPNGTVEISNADNTTTTFTASQWSGPACAEYGLDGQSSFSIGNGNEYGYINNNRSVRFNYQVVSSESMVFNLWFGCDASGSNCDTSATLLLTAQSPYPSCEFYLGSTFFNVCSPYFSNVNLGILWVGSFNISFGSAQVPSCDGTQNVWGTLITPSDGCVNILTESPTYELADPANPSTGGLNVTFPVQSQPNGMSYQVNITLQCPSGPASVPYFQQNGLSISPNSSIYSFTGYSPAACGQPSSCAPTVLGNYTYNLCNFNSSVFNVSASSLGGQLSFTMGQDPVIPCNNSQAWATYYPVDNQCYPLGGNAPTFSPLSNPEQGLQVTFGSGQYGTYNLDFVLLCDPDQESSDLTATFSGFTVEPASNFPSSTFSIVGSSPYACPLHSDTITV